MVNGIPVLGWLIAFAVNVSLAVPFWIFWTVCGIGTKFPMLPATWQRLGFWETVGLIFCISIAKHVAVPKVGASIPTNYAITHKKSGD